MLQIKKKEGESAASLLYRFNKRIQQSGILREAKKRKFHSRSANKNKRLVSALHREQKKAEFIRKKKLGLL
jgi:ribosomal protein S21